MDAVRELPHLANEPDVEARRERSHDNPPERIYRHLVDHATSHTLSNALARVVAHSLAGHSALPTHLGLDIADHEALLRHYYPRLELAPALGRMRRGDADAAAAMDRAAENAELRGTLAEARRDEVEQLERLLNEYARANDPTVRSFCRIVAHGCLGSAHLWHDLGLQSRRELREVLTYCFPELVALNTRDMRWKRFFYRMLCERGGDYICRAPTCEECSSFEECYGTSD